MTIEELRFRHDGAYRNESFRNETIASFDSSTVNDRQLAQIRHFFEINAVVVPFSDATLFTEQIHDERVTFFEDRRFVRRDLRGIFPGLFQLFDGIFIITERFASFFLLFGNESGAEIRHG